MAGRSSIERLPRPIQALVQEAIAEGATIDEIVRLIRTHGGSCSRSAVVRYARRARERLQRWSEDKGLVDFWLKSQGERPEGGTGRLALETLRSLALRAAIALDREEEAPTADQIAPLALAMHRIEGAGKSGAERESAAARMDAGRNKTPKGGGGLSPSSAPKSRASGTDGPRRRTTKARTGSISTPIRCAAPVRHEPLWVARVGPLWATLGRSGPE